MVENMNQVVVESVFWTGTSVQPVWKEAERAITSSATAGREPGLGMNTVTTIALQPATTAAKDPFRADRLLARDGRAWLPITASPPHTVIRP